MSKIKVDTISNLNGDNTIAVTDLVGLTSSILGVKDTAPTVRADGSPLQIGDTYLNSVDKYIYTYKNGEWISEIKSVTDSILDQQTDISNLSDDLGELEIEVNGLETQVGSNTTAIANKISPPPSDGKTYNYKNGAWVEADGGSLSNVFGEMRMLANRNLVISGLPFADGQLISNATAQFPAVVTNLQSSTPTVPVTTPALWLSDPSLRACWAYDSVSDQIRVPDLNGKQSGSFGPMMFRGDGTLGFAPGKIRQDQIQGHTMGRLTDKLDIYDSNYATANVPTAGGRKGAYFLNVAPTAPDYSVGPVSDGTNGPVRTGTETFPTHAVGVWGVVLFNVVSNPGAADAGVLATSYVNQQTRILNLETTKVLSKEFVSDELTMSAGILLSVPHGLGTRAKFFQAEIICKIAEAGYSVGDVVSVATQALEVADAGRGIQIIFDSVNALAKVSGAPPVIGNKTNGGINGLTFANWRLIIRAYV